MYNLISVTAAFDRAKALLLTEFVFQTTASAKDAAPPQSRSENRHPGYGRQPVRAPFKAAQTTDSIPQSASFVKAGGSGGGLSEMCGISRHHCAHIINMKELP